MSKLTIINSLTKARRMVFEISSVESLLNAIPNASMIVNASEQVVIATNRKACELTAYARHELIGLKLENLLLPGESTTIQSFFDDKVHYELHPGIECDVLHHNGNRVPFLLTINHLAGNNSLFLIQLNSQEELRRTSQAARYYQTAWTELVQLISACTESEKAGSVDKFLNAAAAVCGASAFCIYQADGELPVMRPVAVRDPEGIFPEEITPQDLVRLNHVVLWQNGVRPLTALHRRARTANVNFTASAPIGQANAMIGLVVAAGQDSPPESIQVIIQFLAELYYFQFQNSSLLSTLKNDIDISHLSQLENEVVIDTIEDGLIFLTPELQITRLNSAAELALGYTNTEVNHQSIKDVLICNHNLETSFRYAQEELRPGSDMNVRLYRRNGDSFLANLRILPIAAASGLHSILIILHDLSEQEEYKTRNQQLEQRATLADITASFAHEVRNPINNISTGLQLLALNLPENDPNQENIHRLQNDCERLADLVKSGLSFVRPVEYKLEQVDLTKVISNLMDRWRNRLARTQVKYNPQIEPNLPAVEGDLRALEQVFTNLIDNALQAMEPNGGVLTIRLRHVPDVDGRSQVEISILDTGPGIPPEAKEHIFEPFFTTKRNGTGLGLAIVKRIVTAHKGSIHLSSIPGGTMFQVLIPCA